MLEELKDFKGKIILNGKSYVNGSTLPDLDKYETLDIYLEAQDEDVVPIKNKRYEFTVKEDMTEFGSGQLDFHKRWNKEGAMPFRRMSGKVIEEFDDMIKVSLEKAGMHWEGYILKDFIDSMRELNE